MVLRYRSNTRNWFYKLWYIYTVEYLATIKHHFVKEYLLTWENIHSVFPGNGSWLQDIKLCTQMWENTETSDFLGRAGIWVIFYLLSFMVTVFSKFAVLSTHYFCNRKNML